MAAPDRRSYISQRDVRVGYSPRSTPASTLLTLGCLLIPVALVYLLNRGMSEAQLLGMIVVALCGMVVIARPFFGLVLFIGLIYVRPEESIPLLNGIHSTLLIAMMTFFGMVVQLALKKEAVVRAPLVGMVVGFGIIGTLSSEINGVGLSPSLYFLRNALLVLLILNLIRTPERYSAFVTAVIVFTGYLALYSAQLYFSGVGTMDESEIRSRATGIFSDPNDLAATIVAGLALTLSRCFQRRGKARIGYAALSLGMIGAILLTSSRGGLLALISVIVSFAVISMRRKWIAVALAAVCAGILLVAVPGRMTNFDSKEGSVNNRFGYWNEGISQLKQHPVLGIGIDKFQDVNGGFVAHNSFVTCFAEQGLVGYFFWMGCIYYSFRRRSKGIEAPETEATADLVGARISLIGHLVACFWITRTYNPILFLLFTIPFAQQIASSGNPTLVLYPPEERLRNWSRITALCLISIILIWVMATRLR